MSKKSVENEIKLKRAKKAVAEATPYGCAQQLMAVMQNNMPFAATVGLSCAEILKFIEDGKAPKDKTFSQFVAVLCNENSMHYTTFIQVRCLQSHSP